MSRWDNRTHTIDELRLCFDSRLDTTGAIVELEQLCYLFQAESEALRRLDEMEARTVSFRVAPDPAAWAQRLRHQSLSLVEADGLHIDVGCLCQSANCHVGLRRSVNIAHVA